MQCSNVPLIQCRFSEFITQHKIIVPVIADGRAPLYNLIPFICKIPLLIIWKVIYLATIADLNQMTCSAPLRPGPLKNPTTLFLRLGDMPARIWMFLSLFQQQSLRLIMPTPVILVTGIWIRSHGLFSSFEWKYPVDVLERPLIASWGPQFFLLFE